MGALRPELAQALLEVGNNCDREKYFNQHLQRYELILSVLQDLTPVGGRVLDVGAAPGHICLALAKAGYAVHGIVYDLQEDWEGTPAEDKRFQAAAAKLNLQLAECDIQTEDFPFEEGHFDVAVFSEVLEHLWLFPARPVREIHRVLKPGGCLVLTTPNAVHLTARLKWLAGRTSFTSLETMLSLPVHMRHNREYTRDEVERLLRHCGFEAVRSSFAEWHLWTARKGRSHAFDDRPSWSSARQWAKLAAFGLKALHPPLKSGLLAVARKPLASDLPS